MGKGENAGSTNLKKKFFLLSANAFNLNHSKNLSFGQVLTTFAHSSLNGSFHLGLLSFMTLYQTISHSPFLLPYPFTTHSPDFEKEAFRKHFGKRRKCWWPAFSPFPKMFSTFPTTKFKFWFTFILSSACALNLDRSKICSFGKGLKDFGELQYRRNLMKTLRKPAFSPLPPLISTLD